MKSGLPSVCSIVSQEEDSKPRQTSIRNFFGARTNTTTQKSLPTKDRTSSTNEDRESSANGRTDGPVHDAERDVEDASLSHPSIRTFAHPRRIESITSKSADNYRIRKRRRTTAQQQQQLYLDFGQRNFGQTILCSTCGMLMVHGVAADVRRHESICRNYLEGIPWNDSSALKPCWEGTLLTKRREKKFDREEAVRRDLTNRSRMLRDHKGSATDRAYIIEVSYGVEMMLLSICLE
jgi:zinc-finger of acetyl-transferase ESCO